MNNQIAKNIKIYREAAHLSQQALAERLHVSRQAISNWERGVSQPDLDSIFLLASEFQVDVTEIIYGKRPDDEFLASKPKRIKATIIMGIAFFIAILLSTTLVPYFYVIRMYYMATFTALSVTVLPVTYVIGTMFTLSLFSIWLDFRISNPYIRFFLIAFPVLITILYLAFMFAVLIGSETYASFNQIPLVGIIFNWLLNYPVIFIIPGAMLFFGFNRKPQPSAESSPPVQETMPI